MTKMAKNMIRRILAIAIFFWGIQETVRRSKMLNEIKVLVIKKNNNSTASNVFKQ